MNLPLLTPTSPFSRSSPILASPGSLAARVNMDYKFNLTNPFMQDCIRIEVTGSTWVRRGIHCSGPVRAEMGAGGESEESLSTWAQKVV